MFNLEEEYTGLEAQLRESADPEYRVGALTVAPTAKVVYGARMPDVHRIARDWRDAHRSSGDGDFMALLERLLAGVSRDGQLLAMALLERRGGRAIRALDWAQFDHWRAEIDSWPVTDYLGTKFLGPWLALGAPDRYSYLDLLIRDEAMWSRRLALVATAPLNRKAATAVPNQTLALIDVVKHERQPMITKAISWALRELSKSHRESVAVYLDANRAVLPPHVVREVGTKLASGRKTARPTALNR